MNTDRLFQLSQVSKAFLGNFSIPSISGQIHPVMSHMSMRMQG